MTQATLQPLNLKYAYPAQATVPQLFAEAAVSFPDRPALRSEEGDLTYSALLAHALHVAQQLLASGAQPGSLIGMAIPRSSAAVVAILGTLFAGCAYVPLDVEGSPEALLRQQVSASNLSHVLVDASWLCKANAWHQCISIPVLPPSFLGAPPSQPPPVSITANHPAYVMFTSGSTGIPKGVIVPHRAITRLVSAQYYLDFSPNETFLLHSPLSFDASTLELWGSLLHGASLAIAPARSLAIPEYRNLIEQYQVTILWMTSAIFHLVTDYAPETFRSLRQLIVGGDVIQPRSVRTIQQRHPHLAVINGYGPTENCTFTTCYRVPANLDPHTPLPIGRPIEHTTAYVLNHNLEPVPDGESGELVTGGCGVALGYLNLPSETADRFVPDPFAPVRGSRMYRTGDRVYRDASGLIHFLGRLDNEVKISGRRVDLHELEQLVASIHDVRACAACVLDHPSGQKQLALAVEIPSAASSASQLIRSELAHRVPGALLPNRLLVVDRLPVNQNGKLDRAAIRLALQNSSEPSQPVTPPSPHAPALTTVLTAWQTLLNNSSVSADDNFFDAGGTSLLLMRLHAELNQQYPGLLSILDLFQATTPAKLSSLIESRSASPSSAAGFASNTQPAAQHFFAH